MPVMECTSAMRIPSRIRMDAYDCVCAIVPLSMGFRLRCNYIDHVSLAPSGLRQFCHLIEMAFMQIQMKTWGDHVFCKRVDLLKRHVANFLQQPAGHAWPKEGMLRIGHLQDNQQEAPIQCHDV